MRPAGVVVLKGWVADGRQVPVRHPELMILPSDWDEVLVYVPGEGLEIVDSPLITGVNFRRRKRRG